MLQLPSPQCPLLLRVVPANIPFLRDLPTTPSPFPLQMLPRPPLPPILTKISGYVQYLWYTVLEKQKAVRMGHARWGGRGGGAGRKRVRKTMNLATSRQSNRRPERQQVETDKRMKGKTMDE
jgi:hypothetical protein